MVTAWRVTRQARVVAGVIVRRVVMRVRERLGVRWRWIECGGTLGGRPVRGGAYLYEKLRYAPCTGLTA